MDEALKKATIILPFLAVAIISSSLFLIPAFAARESVQVTRLGNLATIDGKWTTADEWSDAYRVSMHLVEGPNSTAYMRLKHDQDTLYVLVDFLSDTTPAATQTGGDPPQDGLNVGIDKNVNDTKTNCCDTYISLYWKNGANSWNQELHPSNARAVGAMSYDTTNDPDSETPHAIYEVAISTEDFAKHSAIRLVAWDPSKGANLQWPRYEGPPWNMAYFGDLIFSEIVVPEFPLTPTALLAAIVLATVLITKRESRPKTNS